MAPVASAAYIFTGSNPSITENFDALAASTGLIPFTVASQVAVPNTGFDVTKLAGSGTANANLLVDTGAASSGALYSYGATGSGDRALGLVASGTNILGYGFVLTNNSSDVISTISLSFKGEVWRTSTTATNTLTAAYGTTASGSTASSYLTASTGMTAITTLNIVGLAPVTTNGAIDGNANSTSYSDTISGLAINPGDSFFVRWQDANDGGNDAGLAIDDLSITVTVPEPTSVLLFLGTFGLATRRRR
jgi:hypothetical protein